MVRGFRQIAVLTLASRVLGMLRDMSFSAFLGCSGVMDIWVIAFKIPNLSRRIFGEGALASSFIPVYVEASAADPRGARRLSATVLARLFWVLSAVTLLGGAGLLAVRHWGGGPAETQRMLGLTATMLPYMVMICLVAACAGILQAHRHFAAPAAAPIVLNVVIIAALLISGWGLGWEPTRQIGFVAVAVLIAGLLQLGLQWWALGRVAARPLWRGPTDPATFRRIMWLMGPMVLGLTATQLNTLADDVVAKALSGSVGKGETFVLAGYAIRYPEWAGCVSSLFYAQRLYQFPLGVLGISLATAIFPVMSRDAAAGDLEALSRTLGRGIRGALFVALPATAGLFLVARPLVAAIFEQGRFTAQDTPLVARTLCFYAVGLTGYFLQQLLTRAFYALQESRVPCRSALLAVGTNVLLNLSLIWPLGRGGLALATALCAYGQVALLSRALRRRLGVSVWAGSARTLGASLVATGVMLAGSLALARTLQGLPAQRWGQVVRLAVLVPAAAGLYWVMARWLRIEALRVITGRRRSPGP